MSAGILGDDVSVVGGADDALLLPIWCGVGLYVIGDYLFGDSSPVDNYAKQASEHTKNKRQSTLEKHQKGQSRKDQDQGNEKGDKNRKRYRLHKKNKK